MIYKESTEFGSIGFGDTVPGNVVKRVVSGMDGKLLLSNPKGKILRSSGKPFGDDYSFIETDYKNGSVDITLYVILRFGVSITGAANELDEGVRREIANVTCMRPNRVKIVITGVLSKNLSKRNIVVETYADAKS
jgi:uncharacterized alkaline shock family protein YloU